MSNSHFYNSINTNDEFDSDMDLTTDPDRQANFVTNTLEVSRPQAEQLAKQPPTYTQSLVNDTDHAAHDMERFPTGEISTGFFIGILGSDDIDPSFGSQAWPEASDQLPAHQPAIYKDQNLLSQATRPRFGEDSINVPKKMQNISPNVVSFENIDPSLRFLGREQLLNHDSKWLGNLGTDTRAPHANIQTFPIDPAPDISVMMNNYNTSNTYDTSIEGQEQMKGINNSFGDQEYKDQSANNHRNEGNASVIHGESASGENLQNSQGHRLLATETKIGLELLSAQYDATNAEEGTRAHDDQTNQTHMSRKQTAPTQSSTKGVIQAVLEDLRNGKDGIESFPSKRGLQNFPPNRGGNRPCRNFNNPGSKAENRSMHADLKNEHRQFNVPTGMRPEDYMNIVQKDPSYMPPPKNFVENMETQMFDEQAVYHRENSEMNEILRPLTDFPLDVFQGLTNFDWVSQPNRYYSTNLNLARGPTAQDNNTGNSNPAPVNDTLDDVISAPRKVRRKRKSRDSLGEPVKKRVHQPWETRLEARYPRVSMLEEEAKVIEKGYEKNPRKTFQTVSNIKSKHTMKAIKIDWSQLELLNANRKKARAEEAQRKKLCKPEDYIARKIPQDYKPTKRLLECYNDWLKEKRENGAVSNIWTNRKRRTAINKVYKSEDSVESGSPTGQSSVSLNGSDPMPRRRQDHI